MAAAVRSLAWLELNINYVCQVYYNTAAFSPCHFTSFEPRFINLNLQSQVFGGELKILNFRCLSGFALTKKL